MMANLKSISCSLFAVFVMYFFVAKPIIDIDITANVSGEVYLYYKTLQDGSYSGDYRSQTKISNTRQHLRFALPSYKDILRLDIADQPFEAVVHKMRVDMAFLSFPIEDFSGSSQFRSINSGSDGISLSTDDDANDPTLFLTVSERQIELARLLLSLFAGFFVFGLTKISNFKRARFISVLSELENKFQSFYILRFKSLNFKLTEFGIFFAIAFVFHIFEISNFLISVDDEYSAFRTTPQAWVADGRWTAYFIEKFLFTQPTMPFVPNLVVCSLMALSYMVLLRAHDIVRDWRAYLVFPIFAAFPTLWFINEFYGNMVIVAFGFLATSISILVFSRSGHALKFSRRSVFNRNLFTATFFLAIAIGAYQSFLTLFVSAAFGVYVLRQINSTQLQTTFGKLKYLFNTGIYTVYGLVAYMLLNALFKFIFPSTHNYIDGFINLNVSLIQVVTGMMKAAIKMYGGSPSIFGIPMLSLGLLVIVASLIHVYRNSQNRLASAAFLVLLLISPFLLNLITANNLPSRSYVAVPYVFWVSAMLVISAKRLIISLAGIFLILILLLQMLNALGNYAAATKIGQLHDRALAASIYERMAESNPEFKREDILLIDVYGFKNIETIYPEVRSSTINASFFDWDGGNIYRMRDYMSLMGYPNLQSVPYEQMQRNIGEFEQMPAWPNSGSVKYSNGIYLIKLGNQPDANHRSSVQ